MELRKILVVDDCESDAVLLKRALTKSGLNSSIDHFPSPKEAIAYLNGAGNYADRLRYPLPEVIFLDLKMPEMDGFKVLKWIKSQPHLGRVIVIVLTGLEDTKKIQHAYDLGAHSFLSKNANPEEVWNIVRFLNGYSRVAQNLPQLSRKS